MSILNDLKQQLIEATTFKLISETFVEINALKIKRIRGQFEKNRRFYTEVSDLYHTVKLSAKRKGLKPHRALPRETQEKSLHVALTSNSRFYGALNLEVMTKFEGETRKTEAKRLIIGQSGLDFINLQENPKAFESIKFKAENPTPDEISLFIEKTANYDRVLIYYPKFATILSQEPATVDITQSASAQEATGNFVENLFEPELPKIIDFLENQIRLLLFKRILLETELSRTAARLMAMNEASERSDEVIVKRRGEVLRAQRSLSNSRLLEVFSGRKVWLST